jgi:hypothetical protein
VSTVQPVAELDDSDRLRSSKQWPHSLHKSNIITSLPARRGLGVCPNKSAPNPAKPAKRHHRDAQRSINFPPGNASYQSSPKVARFSPPAISHFASESAICLGLNSNANFDSVYLASAIKPTITVAQKKTGRDSTESRPAFVSRASCAVVIDRPHWRAKKLTYAPQPQLGSAPQAGSQLLQSLQSWQP